MANDFDKIFDLGGSKAPEKATTKKPVAVSSSAQNKAFKHPAEEKSKTEYVETEGGYMGEGCEEHYNVRFVETEDLTLENNELTPLQKYMVLGEILNNPKFKE